MVLLRTKNQTALLQGYPIFKNFLFNYSVDLLRMVSLFEQTDLTIFLNLPYKAN